MYIVQPFYPFWQYALGLKFSVNLFLLMNAIIHDPSLTPRTTFIISFIEEAIKCGAQYARFILQFMPPTMVGFYASDVGQFTYYYSQ